MRTLLSCVGFCVALALGQRLGGPPWLAIFGVVLACASFYGVLVLSGARRGIALVVGFAAIGAVRGSATQPNLQSRPRLAEAGLLVMEAEKASRPGPRCRVEARFHPSRRPWLLEAPPETCPVSAGEAILVVADELRPAAPLPAQERAWPGLGETANGPDWRRARRRIGHMWRVAAEPGAGPGGRREGWSYWRWVSEARERAWKRSRGDPATGLVVAATLGLGAALPPQHRREMRASGLGHLLAVSGLHVGLAALFFRAIALRAGLLLGHRPAIGAIFALMPMLGYVGLTGAAAPAVRAAIMVSALGVSHVLGRPTHALTSLVIALASMLAWEPTWIWDPGFQLSAAAMVAIATAPVGTGSLAMSWRITWSIAPLASLHFGDATIHAVLSNIVGMPLFCLWVLPTGLLGWVLEPWFGDLSMVSSRAGAQALLDLAAVMSRTPSPGATGLAVIAGAMLSLRVWVRMRAARAAVIWPGWRQLLPPALPLLGLLLVGLGSSAAPVSSSTWAAVGGRRAFATLGSADGELACLRDPGLSVGQWIRLLPALGAGRLVRVEGRASPHLRALRDGLEDAGVLCVGCGRPSCVYAPEASVRAAISQCLRRTGGPKVAVRAGSGPRARSECFERGKWRPLPRPLVSSPHEAPP